MNLIKEHSCGVIVAYMGGLEPLYLLLKQRNGYWSFPKGHREDGETLQETAIRELYEEAGLLDFTLLPLQPTNITYTFQHGDSTHHKTLTLFGATTKSQEVITQESEISEHAWFTYDEAQPKFYYAANIPALTAVHAYLMAVQDR